MHGPQGSLNILCALDNTSPRMGSIVPISNTSAVVIEGELLNKRASEAQLGIDGIDANEKGVTKRESPCAQFSCILQPSDSIYN